MIHEAQVFYVGQKLYHADLELKGVTEGEITDIESGETYSTMHMKMYLFYPLGSDNCINRYSTRTVYFGHSPEDNKPFAATLENWFITQEEAEHRVREQDKTSHKAIYLVFNERVNYPYIDSAWTLRKDAEKRLRVVGTGDIFKVALDQTPAGRWRVTLHIDTMTWSAAELNLLDAWVEGIYANQNNLSLVVIAQDADEAIDLAIDEITAHIRAAVR